VAQLDASRLRLRLRGHQLVLAVDRDAAERAGRKQVEPRGRAELAAELIAHARARGVGIEPELAREGELVGRRLGLAAPDLGEREGLPGSTRNAGSARHSSGSSVARRVDRRRAGELDLPLRLVGGERPDLARRPRVFGRALRQLDRPSDGRRRARLC
jgi:hypothetical protein